MISVSKIYYGKNTNGDYLHKSVDLRQQKSVVIWNASNRCNLNCKQCYKNTNTISYSDELTTIEAKRMIVELARNKIQILVISGGEPLLRKDIFELISFAKSSGIKPILLTNGTMINKKVASHLKIAGTDYVEISLFGGEKTNNDFRQNKDSFQKTIRAITNCQETGLSTGIRMTLTNRNIIDLDKIFDIILNNNINRACFHHLVSSNTANDKYALRKIEARNAINRLIDFTEKAISKIHGFDLVTIDNPSDGPYIYLKLWRNNPNWAFQAYRLLNIYGDLRPSGIGVTWVDSQGNIHPNQYLRNHLLGNIRNGDFARIWHGSSDSLITELRNRNKYLKNRCHRCIWLNICGGEFKIHNDNALCYLTDDEITKAPLSTLKGAERGPKVAVR